MPVEAHGQALRKGYHDLTTLSLLLPPFTLKHLGSGLQAQAQVWGGFMRGADLKGGARGGCPAELP